MLLLENPVRDYAWGQVDGLALMLGTEPSGGPEAELWVGTHPGAPSRILGDAGDRTLAEVIAEDPPRWLGPELAAAGHTALPFLLKVLAIGTPLSLQAHPSAEQAAAGFAREEALGLADDAPERTYRDSNPKPEVLVALGPTWAMCGFRSAAAAADLVARLGLGALAPLVEHLRSGAAGGGAEAMRAGLEWILRLDPASGSAVAVAATEAAATCCGSSPEDPYAWLRSLARQYPNDPACLAALLLEIVELAPDDAVHLPAGNLHAYLSGAGIEVMAASDNVLRGGLTPKHVDIEELLTVLHFDAGTPPEPERRRVGPHVQVYDAGETQFALAVVDPADDTVEIEPARPSLLLASGGPVDVAGGGGGVVLDGGLAVFVAPGEGPLQVSGPGRLWWATTGDGLPA